MKRPTFEIWTAGAGLILRNLLLCNTYACGAWVRIPAFFNGSCRDVDSYFVGTVSQKARQALVDFCRIMATTASMIPVMAVRR